VSLLEYSKVEIVDFRGPWTRLEPTDVPWNRALLAYNCEYTPGSVSTRKGFTQVWNPNEAIYGMYNWVKGADGYSADGSLLFYFSGTSGKVRIVASLVTPGASDLFTQAGAYSISCASSGARLFIATFTTAGVGAGQCRVYGFNSTTLVDKAFLGPLTTKPTLGNTSTGNVTQGLHRVGYILQTRSGFAGKISPVTASNEFDPTSVISAPGGQKISFSVTALWPAEADLIYPVMTPSTDLNRYFIVPGYESGVAVPAGTSWAATATIDVSDEDLMAGSEVTENLNLLTQDSGGAGPFSPFVVLEYRSRIVYLTQDSDGFGAYISEPEKHQNLTADQHVVRIPGFRKITTGFSDPSGLLCLVGPHWTYATRDTGDVPAKWPTPWVVDGAIGTLSPRGVTTNTSRGLVWVADVNGLFLFREGAYGERPFSYSVEPEWRKINWAYAHMVEIKDNPTKQEVWVRCPWNGSTVPNRILKFSYARGLEPEDMDFSMDYLTGFNLGAMEVVQNPNTKQLEIWLANHSAGKVLRQMNASDASPYSDDASGIDWQYETALLPKMGGMRHDHHAAQIRVIGNGTLRPTIYTPDRVASMQWPLAMTLSATPGTSYTRRFFKRSEAISHRFALNGNNEYAVLSALLHLYSEHSPY
jgi:hypothetical protein